MQCFIARFKRELEKDGHKLLYVAYHGSRLHGTNSDTSDIDLAGVFLPSRESCLLNTQPKHYKREGLIGGVKCELNCWSLQYFLQLVSQGEINSLDHLFSVTNPNAYVYNELTEAVFNQDSSDREFFDMEDLYDNRSKLFSIKQTKAFLGYALGQARKYGLKGKRLETLERVSGYPSAIIVEAADQLKDHVPAIIDFYGDETFCYTKDNYLVVNGKMHEHGILMSEFLSRIEQQKNEYGKRSKKAMEAEGIDWKAVSHAVRATFELKQLASIGEVRFPLDFAWTIRNVKAGLIPIESVMKELEEQIAKVEVAQQNCTLDYEADHNWINLFIVSQYNDKLD